MCSAVARESGYAVAMLPFVFLLLPVMASGAAAQPAVPQALATGFSAGQWRIVDAGATRSTGRVQCIGVAAEVLTGGRPANSCQFRILIDEPTKTVVTYTCEGGISGRTELRRDADGIYTVDAQGLENGLPFGARTEWRRVGAC